MEIVENAPINCKVNFELKLGFAIYQVQSFHFISFQTPLRPDHNDRNLGQTHITRIRGDATNLIKTMILADGPTRNDLTI